MVTLEKLRSEKREALLRLGSQHGVTSIKVFGSVARGESSTGSDVDLLVELAPGRTIFDLAGFLADAEDLLGTRVDVVTASGLKYIRERVIAEAVPI